jgi:L-asparaginase/Glu-tRNA(Gln) amidotransferase subunit D
MPTIAGYSLEDLVERATERDIPVVMGCPYPIYLGNPGRYGPSAAALKAGAIPVFNMTMPALVAKFAWVLGQYRVGAAAGLGRYEYVLQEMPADVVGEIDTPLAP